MSYKGDFQMPRKGEPFLRDVLLRVLGCQKSVSLQRLPPVKYLKGKLGSFVKRTPQDYVEVFLLRLDVIPLMLFC